MLSTLKPACTKGGVLVHCVAGVSRSATVCLGYLMNHEQLRYPEAWRILQRARFVPPACWAALCCSVPGCDMMGSQLIPGWRQHRPWVNPNEGFQAQLREFERLGADPSRWCAASLVHHLKPEAHCTRLSSDLTSSFETLVLQRVSVGLYHRTEDLCGPRADCRCHQVKAVGRVMGCSRRPSKHSTEPIGNTMSNHRASYASTTGTRN